MANCNYDIKKCKCDFCSNYRNQIEGIVNQYNNGEKFRDLAKQHNEYEGTLRDRIKELGYQKNKKRKYVLDEKEM